MIKKEHIHCPANAWDCPYYSDEGHPCHCTMVDEGLEPLEECDDFGFFWGENDDFWDDDWEIEDEE